jgi:FkbM family methyltransferase
VSDFEQMLQDYYCEMLRPGEACIDVGAHVGRHTFPMVRSVGREGKVFAFEPIPAIARQLRDALQADAEAASVVELRECALADATGETDFVLVHEAPGYSGLMTRNYDSEVTTETIRVTLERLDDIAPSLPRIRFIKIDCEGAELRVLRGAGALISRDRPLISFECGDASLVSYDYSAGDIFDFLDVAGYDVSSIYRERLTRSEFIAACAQQHYWDYLASPRMP